MALRHGPAVVRVLQLSALGSRRGVGSHTLRSRRSSSTTDRYVPVDLLCALRTAPAPLNRRALPIRFRIIARMSASLSHSVRPVRIRHPAQVRGLRFLHCHGQRERGAKSWEPSGWRCIGRRPSPNGHREFARRPLVRRAPFIGRRVPSVSWTRPGGRWAAAGKGTLGALSPSSPLGVRASYSCARSPPIAPRPKVPGGGLAAVAGCGPSPLLDGYRCSVRGVPARGLRGQAPAGDGVGCSRRVGRPTRRDDGGPAT